MIRLDYSAPALTVFPPICVHQTTTTGREAWRTDVRRPPFYGIYGRQSVAMAPTKIGISSLQRHAMMQPANPYGVYDSMSKDKEAAQ